MRVDLGMNVVASDGEKVGKVERMVFDPKSKQVMKFVVHRGLTHTGDRLVDVDMVTGEDAEGLRLDLTSQQVDELPGFLEENFVVATDDHVRDLGVAMTNPTGGRAFWFTTPEIAGSEFQGRDSLFAPATVPTGEVETRSNLRDTDVVIDSGTSVVGSDGETLGKVGQVLFNADGSVAGFIVQKGLIFKHDIRVPIDMVRETGGEHIILTVPSAEAETLAYHAEDSTL